MGFGTNTLKRLNKSGEKPRFFELSKESLEDYYDNLRKGLTQESKNEILKVKKSEQGLVKMAYAQQIENLVNSKEDFHNLFNGELDFLME
jgi:vancomycin resistance protein YoaR